MRLVTKVAVGSAVVLTSVLCGLTFAMSCDDGEQAFGSQWAATLPPRVDPFTAVIDTTTEEDDDDVDDEDEEDVGEFNDDEEDGEQTQQQQRQRQELLVNARVITTKSTKVKSRSGPTGGGNQDEAVSESADSHKDLAAAAAMGEDSPELVQDGW